MAALLSGAAALGLDLALGRPGTSSDLVRFVGRFHPLVVHLPIGFLLLVAFAEGLSLLPRFRARVDPVLGLLWPALVASATLAFAVGLLLAHDGGYPLRLVTWHRRLTLTAVLGIAATFALWSRVERGAAPRAAYRGLLALSLGVLSVGAHFGGSLSRGENYLFELAPSFLRRLVGVRAPVAAPAPASAAAPAAEPLVYRDVVAPIFEAHCVECHGAKKTKGELRLDSFAAISKGGKHGAELVVGDSARSRLVERMLLPRGDDDHMPPEDKSQPTPGELELIRWWIERGANETLRVRDTLVPDSARPLLIHSLSAGAIGAFTPPLPPPETAPREASKPPSVVAAPAAAPAPASPAAAGGTGELYADVIAPLLADRCGRCHGPQKQKGKLRVDSLAALEQGGKGGAGLVAGSSTRGSVLARIALPIDDEHHMPPSDERQLSANQISLIGWFAKAGASAEIATRSAPAALVSSARARGSAPKASSAREAGERAASASLSRAPESKPELSSTSPEHRAPVRAALPSRVDLYHDLAEPLLKQRCAGCHGGADPDGDLRIEDRARLLASGAVVPGKPAQSEIVVRMRTPPGKSGHMPPTLAAQPAAPEIEAIELWIARGAAASSPVESATLSDPLAELVSQLLAARPSSEASAASEPGGTATPEPGVPANIPPRVPPQHAGCAACALAASRPHSPPALLAASLLLLALARRTSRPGSPARRTRPPPHGLNR